MSATEQSPAAATTSTGNPGGVLELDETIHDGLRREIHEKPDSTSNPTRSPASTRTCPVASSP